MAGVKSTTGSRVPSLDERGARALIEAFVASVEPFTYRVSNLPKDGPILEILSLDGVDLRKIVSQTGSALRALREDGVARHRQLLSPGAAGPWLQGHGGILGLLLAKILSRRVDLGPDELIALISGAYDSTHAYCVYESGLFKALENFAAEGPFPSALVSSLEGYLVALRKGYTRENAAAAVRLEQLLRPGAAIVAAPRTATSAEHLLLHRAQFQPQTPCLADAFLAAMSVPAEDNDLGAVSFGDVACTPPLPRHLIDDINALLSGSASNYRDHTQIDTRSELATSGIRGAIAMTAAAAAMSSRPIRYSIDSNRAQRFHNGCHNLLTFTLKALSGVHSAEPAEVAHLCHSISRFRPPEYVYVAWSEIAAHICRLLAPHAPALSEETLFSLIRAREWFARVPNAGDRAGVADIDELVNIGDGLPIQLGEPWTDRLFADLLELSPQHRAAWTDALNVMTQAKGATPTAKWLKAADATLKPLPLDLVERHLAAWFPLVGRPRPVMAGGKIPGKDSSIPSDSSADILRGLAFLASGFDTPAMARALGDLAMACFKMVPGHGARCIKPGSSALWSLAQMTTPSALAQLSRLRQLVKFGTAKKMLDTSLNNLAAKLGITTDELHEIAAPDFGLSPDATLDEDAGDYTLQLVAEPAGARIRVLAEDGKERKSIPDVVKKEHADTLKSLKQAKDDIDKMLEAHRARIDALFIADRAWPVSAWRERYIDHPLVGVLGRRLIWSLTPDAKSPDRGRAVLFRPDSRTFVDLAGAPVTPDPAHHARLWHPIFATADEVRRWREVIESSAIRQPVKQAHREVYPLTDAERRTATYSNRYAAHIIKQHAFQQLAAERGWTSKLRLMVDAEYPPPSRSLPSWALRAEFWIESVGDNYGTDTTESGSYLYLATDQVRFYRQGAATAYAHAGGGSYTTRGADAPENHPLPLEQIPPLVFSEIMRDVDLFVAGASVGNNADWQDGGPQGRFREYWSGYSFGELTASGTARREFLERLIPRLKIAPLCSFEDKFLIVKGTLRTYKIHLGSGNILMKPNDQYLCIVPNSSFHADSGPGGVFLPFDGDRTLSIILSKAFLLAEDAKIKDASITAQINRA